MTIETLKAGLALDSTNGQANIGTAWQLWSHGNGDDALAYVSRAVRFNPLAPDVLEPAAQIGLGAGMARDADTYCQLLRRLGLGDSAPGSSPKL